MNYPAYIQMEGNTVANARRMPLDAIKAGDIYLVMGTYLCRVVKIGHTDYPEIPSMTEHDPNCITIEYVGYRILTGRWWEKDWTKTEADTHQYALCYFFPWDRQGVLYGSAKAKQLQKKIRDLFQIGWKLRGHEHRTDKQSVAIYQKARQQREQWDVDVAALFNSLADSKRYPKLPPAPPTPPRIHTKVTPAEWSIL